MTPRPPEPSALFLPRIELRPFAALREALRGGYSRRDLRADLPRGVLLYEIAGPLFFGAAQKAMSALHSIAGETHVVVLDIQSVTAIDATGLVNLESTVMRLHRSGILVILAGVRPQPARVLAGVPWARDPGRLMICTSVSEALERARALAA